MEDGRFCAKCGEFKPFSEFYKHIKGKYGVSERCKECTKAIANKYYQDNTPRILSQVHEYRRKHPERVQQSQKEYRTTHKKELNLAYRQRLRRDEVFRRIKQSRSELRRIILAAQKNINRGSYLISFIGLPPTELWQYLLKTWEQEYGASWNGEKYNIDHIIPCCSASTVEDIDKLFHYTNLRLLTPEDNTKKKAEDLKYCKSLGVFAC